MKIRPGVSRDVAAVLALDRETQTAPHWNEVAYLRALDTEKGRCLFVAEHDGLWGFAVGALVSGEAELESVVVSIYSRRRGIGRKLCAAVVDWAGAAGAASIALEVRAGSAGAIALYESLQFHIVGRRKAYYAQPIEDALIMHLPLQGQT